MRNGLLTTTALVAVGLMAGSAQAADRIKMGIGGYFNGYLVFGNQDDGPGEPGANRRDHKIAREAEIHFVGSTTLDNGIRVGVNVQLEAESCADQIDESYIWTEGTFGRIELGAEDPSTDAMYYGSPSPIVGIGLSTPDDVFTTLSNSVGTPATITNISGDSEKITYFTPRLAGIQLGLSYTPDSCEEGTGCGGTYAGFQRDDDAGQQSEIVEVAGNYVTKLSALDVALYAGYAKGKLEVPAAGSDDQEQWGIGAEFGFAGFTFGAAYKDDDQGTTGADTDRTDWSVGILYGTGPWTMGVEYVHAEVEEGAGLGTDETDGVQIGGSYDLGPGILLTGGVALWDVQDNLNNPANENDGLELIFGTVLEF